MPGHHGGSSSSSSSSSGGGGGGEDAREQYGAVGQYSAPASPPSISKDDDGRLNYLTGAYQDINITPEQKETLEDQRQEAISAISPMSKLSNIAIGVGLNSLIPGAGYLFSHYKSSTAMGYSMTNPLTGLVENFGDAKDFVADKFGGLLSGPKGNFSTSGVGDGQDNNRTIMNTIAPLAPYVVSETTPQESEANKWYNSIGKNTVSKFNFASAYANAKTKVTNNLKNHGPLAQLAVSNSPYYDWLKTNKIDRGIL